MTAYLTEVVSSFVDLMLPTPWLTALNRFADASQPKLDEFRRLHAKLKLAAEVYGRELEVNTKQLKLGNDP